MPRNHGRTAIWATCMVHSKIRTILRVLTILTILRSGFAQERSSFNKDNDRDYLVEWNEAYGPPTGLSIFVKEVDNETSERDRSTSRPKETSEGSKEKRYPRWWKYKEERIRGEEDRWKKDVKKAVLTALGGNTVRRTIGKEYFEAKSSEEKTRGIGEVKENEENEEEKETRGNNEESSRSNEDRNFNNFMTKPGTPRNRKSEREKEENREEDREEDRVESERSTGVRGRRSSWILRGASIKRSIREDATRGNLSRKGEMSFSTASELDDDLRRHREKSGSSNRWRRRRKERKRRRRGANSFFTLGEWNASNRSSLEKHKVRTEATRTTKEMGRGQEVIIKKKEEDGKFMTTIYSRDERQKRKETSEMRDEKKNGNRVETFERKFRKEEGGEEDNASRRGVVDNFSEDTTFSSLSTKVRKSTRKEPDAANRGRLSADSRVRSRYQDNIPLDEKAVGFPVEEETENEDSTTTAAATKTGRENLVRDTTEKVDKEKGKGMDADLKSRKNNILGTTKRIRSQRKRILKETSTELPTLPPSGSIKYTKGERYSDKNWIGKSEVASLDRNESFPVSISSILATNVSLEKEKEKDRGDRGGTIMSTTPIYFSREQKEEEEETMENESPSKNSGGDTRGGKESVVGSVGNISRNTVVSWNSTYPNHDTFDSSWVYSAGRPIVESNGRGAEESSKDSKRNVGDPMESSKSPKLLETFLPRFPIANGSIVKDEKSRTGNSGDLKTRGKVQRYEENEGVMKNGGKKFGRITSSVRDSRTGENREKKEEGGGGGGEEMKEKKISETISLEYFPRSTSLTNWEITTTQGAKGIEGSGEKAAEDREVSDYEKEINDTASEPASTYKFELLESVGELDSTTSSVSTATSNDIREKTVGNEDREKKDSKMERLKEEEDSSNSKQTILSKSKRSKSIGLRGIGETSTDSNGRPRVAEKSGRNQETKTDESVDPISKSHGNVRSSWQRRDLTETTEDVSTAESSLERTSTLSSSPSDRSISVTGVEIEGITSSPLLDVPYATFPSDRFNTIAATTIEENPRASDTPERSTISWVETTIGNVSYRQSIGSTHNTSITNQWPVKHSAVVEGDLVLGGLMMVHEREDTITCGPVMPQGGVQALEAMLYTLDTLNQREIVPGVKIGAHILDDCDKDTYGLEMAVDFIKGRWICRIRVYPQTPNSSKVNVSIRWTLSAPIVSCHRERIST
ncbi:hypothetical protein KPH14_007344 [Odynerus spinipes]|uniref:Metabotropic glutamate receptor n=1 Tax=Odynerus spinipes TaxID=1348599 RepID=A0AAD9RA38_9HYME|nr:hypothetical protein KPH14_007344 [Odynerus spinipes]